MDIWKASSVGDLERVRQLIQDGQDVNGDKHSRTTPLMWAADGGHDQVVCELIRAGADVNRRNKYKQTALHLASQRDHPCVVEILSKAGANVNEKDKHGVTPLMVAAATGHAYTLLELIRAGADVSVVNSMQIRCMDLLGHSPLSVFLDNFSISFGMRLLIDRWPSLAADSTALHVAAKLNSTECGVLLVEAGSGLRTKNKDSKSPLDLASFRFRRAIQQAQSFSAKRIVAVIGHAEHGKSTLIAALQAEANNPLKKLTNRFTKVQDIRQRTAGIETVEFSSHKYGETLFYDFAGQTDYHGPHQCFLEAMLSKPGVSVSLLLLVKSTDEEDIITRQVTRWLQPLFLTSAPSTPQVILVGSFLDQVEFRKQTTEKLLRCTQSLQEQFHFNIQGPCLLDCRKPDSKGIDQICTFLQEAQPLQLTSTSFSYNLHWILVQLRRSLSIPAITLYTFQSWLLMDAKLMLRNFPPAEQICHDLTAVGYTLFLPNKQDPSQSWLILDLQAILHEVYGTLFSGSQGKVNQFGLLHCSQLTELFPKFNPAMLQEVLVSLEFCIQANSTIMREELLKLIGKDMEDRWLYFPALVSAQPLEVFPEDPHPQHLQWACWQLRATGKHFISARLMQTIILRLAANHVFTHEISPSMREHCCSVWVNGLSWRSTKGVDVVVQISDSSVVQVVGRSRAGPEKLHQYMSTIVSDVIKTTAQLSPKLEATSYIIHPYTPAMWEGAKTTPPDSLYPVSSIIHCICDGGDYVLSLPRQAGRLPLQTSLTELFGGWSPPLSVVQDMDIKREPLRGEVRVVCASSLCVSEGIPKVFVYHSLVLYSCIFNR